MRTILIAAAFALAVVAIVVLGGLASQLKD